jgi:hypothetical protein
VTHLNDMVARSVMTTRAKGFRQDWEDAEILERIAEAIENHNLDGDEHIAVDLLRRIAQQHRALTIGTKLALVAGEAVGEALEEIRDHGLEKVMAGETGFASELADVHIRLFDISDLTGVDIEAAITAKQDKNDTRPRMHGRKF